MIDLSLEDLSLVDHSPHEGFDRLTRLASKLLDVPVALVSIVETEKDRQYFTSSYGLGEPWASARQTPLSHSFCQHVKASSKTLRIEDARIDPLVQDNLAIRDLDVVAYLGIPVFGPNGRALGALCAIDNVTRNWSSDEEQILTDLAAAVTDQIELRAALYLSQSRQQASEHFGRIVENATHEVFSFDPGTLKFLNVNKGARMNLGYSPEEVQGLTPVDIKPEFTQAEFEGLIEPLLCGALPVLELETKHQRKDGSTYDVSIRLEYHSSAEHSVFIAFCEDITERIELERIARENSENFSGLFRNAQDPMVISKADTTLLLVNPAYEAHKGESAQNVLGRQFIDLVPAGNQQLVRDALAAATPENPTFTILQKEILDGRKKVLMWTNVVSFNNGEPAKIFSIANDVTELLEAQDLAERAAEKAQRAFEVRKVFLANMSHEVRTPLNAIMGLFQLIQMADVPERQKKQAQVGLNASHHLLSQLVNVLEISRMEADAVEIHPELTDLAALAEVWKETALATNHRLGKPIEVSLNMGEMQPDQWLLDPRRVTQIVNNLTDNALKFTKEGRVEISLKPIAGRNSTGPGHLEISVADTGCGVPREQQNSVFERFVQADDGETRENGGSGLGLAVSRELADLMGATLQLESPAAGSCFTTVFTLRLFSGAQGTVRNDKDQEDLVG